MKFHEIIKTNNWLSLEATLLKLYPDQAKNIEAYQDVFSKLQTMKSLKTKTHIEVAQRYADKLNEEDYVEVYGIEQNRTATKSTHVAIEFTPWKTWLGMEISTKTLKEFNELEIISHCLYEMTFVGFNEADIQKELSSLKKSVDELKNMTDEERKKNTTSLDDLLKELGSE
jgi:hypothetical protein